MDNFDSSLPRDLIKQFLATDVKLSFYVSGGCGSILGWITVMPGSSKNVAETRNPYAKGALADLLGYVPYNFVDISVAKDLAFKAFVNTQKYMYIDNENNLHFEQKRILGVGVTGALASNYQRKGNDHAYFTLFDQKKVVTYYILLAKDKRSREEEDYFVSYNVLNVINTTTAQKPGPVALVGNILQGDSIKIVEEIDTIDFLLPTLEKQIKNVIFLPEGTILVDQVINKCIVIPGSFNPLHDGHVELGNAVADKFGVKRNDVIFELSAMNADKGLITHQELDKRIKMIVDKGFVGMLTVRPFFYSKNEYLREGCFVVGADTYKRIVDTKYYSNSKEVMNSKLSEFGKYKNGLVVAPRLNPQTNELEKLGDYEIPDVMKPWLHELQGFRVDISSTELREQDKKSI